MMCRMFAWIGKGTLPLPRLRELSKEHKDGWGVGYFENGKAKVKKSTIPAWRDSSFNQITQINSQIALLHLRKASVGSVSLLTTQPFKRGAWLFAHQGTIHKPHRLNSLINLRKTRIVLDSAIYFSLFRKNMKNNNIFQAIEKTIQEISMRCDYTALNFLASDDERLYGCCEYKKNPQYYTLHYATEGNFFIGSEPIGRLEYQTLKNHEVLIANKELCVRKKMVEV